MKNQGACKKTEIYKKSGTDNKIGGLWEIGGLQKKSRLAKKSRSFEDINQPNVCKVWFLSLISFQQKSKISSIINKNRQYFCFFCQNGALAVVDLEKLDPTDTIDHGLL